MWFGDTDLIIRFFDCLCKRIRTDIEIKISDIASELIIGESDLYRQIKRITGLTPCHFINVLRFYGAREMLIFNYPIDDIQFKIKVDSESYFYKTFRQLFGTTPRNCKMKYGKIRDMYRVLIYRCKPELFKKYFQTSRSALRNFYRKQFPRIIADILSSDEIHFTWIKTFIPRIYSNHILEKDYNQ